MIRVGMAGIRRVFFIKKIVQLRTLIFWLRTPMTSRSPGTVLACPKLHYIRHSPAAAFQFLFHFPDNTRANSLIVRSRSCDADFHPCLLKRQIGYLIGSNAVAFHIWGVTNQNPRLCHRTRKALHRRFGSMRHVFSTRVCSAATYHCTVSVDRLSCRLWRWKMS